MLHRLVAFVVEGTRVMGISVNQDMLEMANTAQVGCFCCRGYKGYGYKCTKVMGISVNQVMLAMANTASVGCFCC